MQLAAGKVDGNALSLSGVTGNNSIARKISSVRTREGFAWRTRGEVYGFMSAEWEIATQTPVLPTDATCVTTEGTADVAKDGIYDCLEDQSTDTFFGMPLYDWGARTGQVDLFLEVDYMDCMLSGSAETQPYKAVLDKVVAMLGRYNGRSLHIDIGDLYDGSTGTNAAKYDLGGGNNYLPVGSLADYEGITLDHFNPGSAIFYALKEEHFSIIRKQFFYYMVVAKNGLSFGGYS